MYYFKRPLFILCIVILYYIYNYLQSLLAGKKMWCRQSPHKCLVIPSWNSVCLPRTLPTVIKWVSMWDVITSVRPFLRGNKTLNLERSVQKLLNLRDYKKLPLNVRSHCVTQCFASCLSLPCSTRPCVYLHPNVRLALEYVLATDTSILASAFPVLI